VAGVAAEHVPAVERRIGDLQRVFAADKVWVTPALRGAAQIETSRELWGVPRFDLLQVHNLLSWQEHLPQLLEMKAAGRLRYVGITTSEGRRHDEVVQVMRMQPVDFVQVSYNLLDREVEQRILPLAQQRGIGVIVNRPFREGALLRQLARHRLPAWAAEIDCAHWAQVALKFIVSHPAVTCAIPATSQVAHVRQNMAAARGRLPDAALRQVIVHDLVELGPARSAVRPGIVFPCVEAGNVHHRGVIESLVSRQRVVGADAALLGIVPADQSLGNGSADDRAIYFREFAHVRFELAHAPRQRGKRLRSIDRDTAALGHKAQDAIEGSAVEEMPSETLRQQARDGALAGRRRAVDCDDRDLGAIQFWPPSGRGALP